MPLSDRVDTEQRPVHHQQQAANRCTVRKVPFLCCGRDGRQTVFWHHVVTVEVGLNSTLHNPLSDSLERKDSVETGL